MAYLPPINHTFFLQNTSCIRKPQVISGERGGGLRTPCPCTLPQDPPMLLSILKPVGRLKENQAILPAEYCSLRPEINQTIQTKLDGSSQERHPGIPKKTVGASMWNIGDLQERQMMLKPKGEFWIHFASIWKGKSEMDYCKPLNEILWQSFNVPIKHGTLFFLSFAGK